MLFSTMGQGALFLWMMLAGFAIGAWYALTAALRRFIRAGFWLGLLCDLLFGLGCAAILLAALLLGSWGEARFFAFIGVILGILIFILAFAAPFQKIEAQICKLWDRFCVWWSENRLIKVILK